MAKRGRGGGSSEAIVGIILGIILIIMYMKATGH